MLTEATGMKVYFAHPHSPWNEAGTRTSTASWRRQYLPKESNLSVDSEPQIDDIAWNLNTRPRKSIGWKCPADVFFPVGVFGFSQSTRPRCTWTLRPPFRFAKMFVMSGRPIHHPDAFLSESFRKPEVEGYIKTSGRTPP